MMRYWQWRWVAALGLASIAPARAAGQGDQVFVVYNTRVAESKDVANHYAEKRAVPAAQVLGLDLPDTETISRDDFKDRLQKPLRKALESKKFFVYSPRTFPSTNGQPRQVREMVSESKIRYLVLCYGVPLHIAEDTGLREDGVEKLQAELRRNEAAVDSELACLPFADSKMLLTGPINNMLYRATNANLFNPTNGLLMVTRLDGPTAAVARGLVDKAMQADEEGLWGRAYFDLRGLTNAGYKLGDDRIMGASQVCRRLGFETYTDYGPGTLTSGFPLSQVALYAGWYDESASGPFARPTVEFMPGAFAYHLHSFSAVTLRSTTRGWAGPLIAKGATATMGCVAEPFLVFTPDVEVFFVCFVQAGYSFGEAAYASSPAVSWQTTVVGDPLYRPFGKSPLERQQYLEQKNSKLMEWSYLRLVNFKIAGGTALTEVTPMLEGLEYAKQSSVLTEKLGDLYALQGKPASSVHAWQQALKLNPSPQQEVRIMLELGKSLTDQEHPAEAYEVYQQFLTKHSDYPEMVLVCRHLVALAEKLGKKEDAEKYQLEVNRLNAPGPPPK
jgi:uncharacterized protein (TIGR03790 family)